MDQSNQDPIKPELKSIASVPGPTGSTLNFFTPRLVSGIELLLITFGYFGILWLVAPNLETNGLINFMKVLLITFVCYYVYLSPALLHKDSLTDRGLASWRTGFIRTDNLRTAGRYYLYLTLIGVGVVVVIASFNKPNLLEELDWGALWLKFGFNLFNAFFQDMLFLAFFLPRLKDFTSCTQISGVWSAVCMRYNNLLVPLACAVLFALYHTPNPQVMLITFTLGFAVAFIYYHSPNLVLAILSHAVIGTALHRVLELHMRIGPFYWESDKYVYRTLFPTIRELIGNAF